MSSAFTPSLDGNDTPYNAIVFGGFPATLSGEISSVDFFDYFKFTTETGGILRATITGQIDPYLIEDARFVDYQNDGSRLRALTGGFIIINPGTYYFQVLPENSNISSTAYTITASLDPGAPIDNDNDLARATLIQVPSSQTGRVGGLDEADFFRFTATETGIVSFNLTGEVANAFAVVHRVVGGSSYFISDSAGTDASKRVDVGVTAGQSYLVEVGVVRGSVANYTLIGSFGPATLDNNDTRATATVRSSTFVEQGIVGGLDPADVFRFTGPPQPGSVRIELVPPFPFSSLVRLTVSSGSVDAPTEITGSFSSDNNREFRTLPGQTYFVSASSTSLNANVNYTIRSTFTPDPPDTNTSLATAGTITGSTYSSWIGGSDKADYVRITPSQTATYLFDLVNTTSDVDVELYDDADLLLASGSSALLTVDSVRAALVAGRTYYLKLIPVGSAITSYTVIQQSPTAATFDPEPGRLWFLSTTPYIGEIGGADTSDNFSDNLSSFADARFVVTNLGADARIALYQGTRLLAEAASQGSDTIDISFNNTFGSDVEEVRLTVPAGSVVARYTLTPIVRQLNLGDQNNTLPTAETRLFPFTASSNVGNPDTADYYRFVAPASGTARFDASNFTQDVNLAALDSTGGLLISSEASGLTPERVTFSVVAGQSYIIRLLTQNPLFSSQYLLTSTFTPSSSSDGDDNFVTATARGLPFTVTGSAGGSDPYDFHRMTASANGFIKIELSSLGANHDLVVYDAGHDIIGSSSNAGTANESIAFRATAGQTYWIRVGKASTSGSYTLSGSFSAAPADDANNDFGAARTLVLGAESGDVVGSTDSDDIYRLTATSDGPIRVQLSGLSANADLAVFGADQRLVAESRKSGVVADGVVIAARSGESFFIRVRATDLTAATYTVGTSVLTDDGDGSFAAASLLTDQVSGVSGSAGGSDPNDVYRVTATMTGSGSVSLARMAADLDLSVYDSSRRLVVSSRATGTGDEFASFPITAGDIYYIQVEGAAGAPNTPYVIRFAETASNGGDGDDSFESATSLASNSSVAGSVGLSDTNDTFRFVPTATGQARISLDTLGTDADLLVFDSDRRLLASGHASGASNESVTFAVTADRTYFIRVVSGAGQAARYDLTTSLNPTGADGNDTSLTAESLSSAFTVNGSVGNADADDFYRFIAPRTGAYKLNLRGLTDNLNLRFLSATATEITSGVEPGISPESLTFNVIAGESYVVRVDPNGRAVSSYFLSGGYAGTAAIDGNESAIRASWVTPTTKEIDSIDAIDRDDYFRFTAQGMGQISLSLTGHAANLDLKFYDSSGVLLASSTQSGTDSEAIETPVTAGSDYVIRVEGIGDAVSRYVLSTSFLASGSDNGNDLITAPQTVDLGAGVYGSVGRSDPVDYFSFTPPTSGAYRFVLSDATVGVTASVFATNSSLRLGTTNPASGPVRSTSVTLTAGQTYVVSVSTGAGLLGSYRLSAASASDGNDTTATAQLFTLGGSEIGDFSPSDATDYYQITPETDGVANVSLRLTRPSGDFSSSAFALRAYDGDAALMVERTGTYASSTGAVVLSFQVSLAAGRTYYLGAFALATSTPTVSYSISTEFTPGGTDGNDSFAAASPRNPGLTGQSDFVGGNDTADYFAITATQSGLIPITIRNLSANLSLIAFDDQQSILVQSLRAGNADETVSLFVGAGRTYFVQVAPVGVAQSAYTYDIGALVPVVTSETTDVGSASFSARNVYVGMTFSATLTSGDSDWYAIPISAGDRVVVSVRGAESGGGTLTDPDIVVRTATGGVIQDVPGAPGGDVSVTLSAGSSLMYVDVRSATGATGTYQISVTRAPAQAGAQAAANELDYVWSGGQPPDAPELREQDLGYALTPQWQANGDWQFGADFQAI